MATYKYQQNFFDGAAYGYVKYNIAPDFGTSVAPGETVTITGVMYDRNRAVKGISVESTTNASRVESYINKSAAKGVVTTFVITFPMWTLSSSWGDGRTINLPIEFTLWDMPFNSDGYSPGLGIGTFGVSGQEINYIRYRLNVSLRNVQFERYDLINESYVKNDEGRYLLGSLCIALSEERQVSDITVATVRITSDGGFDETLNIPTEVLSAAISPSGYVETSPALFASIDFDTANNYTLLFTFGDEYNTYSFTETVSRAFANVHLSGASTGGVAFGKFSSSTEGNPLFECEYPAIFGGGILPGFVEVIPLTLDGNFRDYTDGSSPRLYRFGNLVCLTGISSPTRALTVSSTSQNYPMFTIPEGLRPVMNIATKCVGSSTTTWVLSIDSETGVCNACRNIGTGGYTNFSAGNWMPYNVMWIIV